MSGLNCGSLPVVDIHYPAFVLCITFRDNVLSPIVSTLLHKLDHPVLKLSHSYYSAFPQLEITCRLPLKFFPAFKSITLLLESCFKHIREVSVRPFKYYCAWIMYCSCSVVPTESNLLFSPRNRSRARPTSPGCFFASTPLIHATSSACCPGWFPCCGPFSAATAPFTFHWCP